MVTVFTARLISVPGKACASAPPNRSPTRRMAATSVLSAQSSATSRVSARAVPRERKAAGDDAQYAQLREVRLPLDHFVRNPSPGAAQTFGIEDDGLGGRGLQHHRPSAHSSTAIRTHNPLRACRKYAALGSASTSGSISPRRGSGCMRMACSGKRRITSGVTT